MYYYYIYASISSVVLCFLRRLPLPWLLYGISSGGEAYPVNSEGMFCSIVLLFAMLLMVVTTIGA